MPDFIIIGAQRSGTTSLYAYITQHPQVTPAIHKELHFFDNNFARGLNWYRAHFPSRWERQYVRRICRQDLITGEASPYYLFHPLAPRRVAGVLPRVRLIVILRNPVDRAYSHYRFEVRRGRETESFEDAIRNEQEQLRGEQERMIEDERYRSCPHQWHSYLARGIYAEQLVAWRQFFPAEQFQVLISEEFFTSPRPGLQQVFTFLNVPDWEPSGYAGYLEGHYPEMDRTTRERLLEYFRPHNRRLYEYLGRDLDWDK